MKRNALSLLIVSMLAACGGGGGTETKSLTDPITTAANEAPAPQIQAGGLSPEEAQKVAENEEFLRRVLEEDRQQAQREYAEARRRVALENANAAQAGAGIASAPIVTPDEPTPAPAEQPAVEQPAVQPDNSQPRTSAGMFQRIAAQDPTAIQPGDAPRSYYWGGSLGPVNVGIDTYARFTLQNDDMLTVTWHGKPTFDELTTPDGKPHRRVWCAGAHAGPVFSEEDAQRRSEEVAAGTTPVSCDFKLHPDTVAVLRAGGAWF